MDEARRFFRYVTPGITFFTELLLFVWIILPNFVETKIRSLNTEAGLGFAVGLILVSGGFGFLLGTVHHFLHWHFPYRAIDHVNFVNLLINPKTTDNTIEIDETVMRNINAVNEHKISTVPDREHAWIIVTALWNSRTEKVSM